jgi:hypothetical protein
MKILEIQKTEFIRGVLRTELFTITNKIGITKIQEKMHDLIEYFPINKKSEEAELEYKLMKENNKRIHEENRAKELDILYIELKQDNVTDGTKTMCINNTK